MLQICLVHFKFEPQSMARICICVNLYFTSFNLSVHPVNSDSNLKS